MDSVKCPWLTTRQRRPSGVRRARFGIGDLDRDSGAACLGPGEAGQQDRAGDGMLRRRHQLRGVPGADQLGVGGLAADVGHVLVLPGDLPLVMVVVAGHVVDDRVERGRAVTEGQVREEAEHHGAHLVERQGQVQDVARQDEGRRPVLAAGQLADAVDQAAEQRARPLRVGGEAIVASRRGPLVERGQHAVLRPEVQVGQDDVADVSHDDPRSAWRCGLAAAPGRRPATARS